MDFEIALELRYLVDPFLHCGNAPSIRSAGPRIAGLAFWEKRALKLLDENMA
jgi:hypothetical protein